MLLSDKRAAYEDNMASRGDKALKVVALRQAGPEPSTGRRRGQRRLLQGVCNRELNQIHDVLSVY